MELALWIIVAELGLVALLVAVLVVRIFLALRWFRDAPEDDKNHNKLFPPETT